MTQPSAPVTPKKTNFLRIGVIVFLAGVVTNSAFRSMDVGGLLRELSRLATLVGFFMMIFGGIYRLTQRSPKIKN